MYNNLSEGEVINAIKYAKDLPTLKKLLKMVEHGKRKGLSNEGVFEAARNGYADVWEYWMKMIEGQDETAIQSSESVDNEVKQEEQDSTTSLEDKELQASLPENIRLKKKLGSGQFGDVYSASMTMNEGTSSQQVAIKFLQKADETAINNILDELSLLR